MRDSGTLVGPSNVASETPPKLVMQTIDGNEVAVWDDVSRFGPVPESKMRGRKSARAWGIGPWGYHPMAMDVNGNPFDGGGYLCRFD